MLKIGGQKEKKVLGINISFFMDIIKNNISSNYLDIIITFLEIFSDIGASEQIFGKDKKLNSLEQIQIFSQAIISTFRTYDNRQGVEYILNLLINTRGGGWLNDIFDQLGPHELIQNFIASVAREPFILSDNIRSNNLNTFVLRSKECVNKDSKDYISIFCNLLNNSWEFWLSNILVEVGKGQMLFENYVNLDIINSIFKNKIKTFENDILNKLSLMGGKIKKRRSILKKRIYKKKYTKHKYKKRIN